MDQWSNQWTPTDIRNNDEINLNNTDGDPARYALHSEICYADQHYVYKNHDQNLHINNGYTHLNANKKHTKKI